ncbi:MAG: hypothetical protein U0Y96_13950 [Candidatus Kapaibacterium sp.]
MNRGTIPQQQRPALLQGAVRIAIAKPIFLPTSYTHWNTTP